MKVKTNNKDLVQCRVDDSNHLKLMSFILGKEDTCVLTNSDHSVLFSVLSAKAKWLLEAKENL